MTIARLRLTFSLRPRGFTVLSFWGQRNVNTRINRGKFSQSWKRQIKITSKRCRLQQPALLIIPTTSMPSNFATLTAPRSDEQHRLSHLPYTLPSIISLGTLSLSHQHYSSRYSKYCNFVSKIVEGGLFSSQKRLQILQTKAEPGAHFGTTDHTTSINQWQRSHVYQPADTKQRWWATRLRSSSGSSVFHYATVLVAIDCYSAPTHE